MRVSGTQGGGGLEAAVPGATDIGQVRLTVCALSKFPEVMKCLWAMLLPATAHICPPHSDQELR